MAMTNRLSAILGIQQVDFETLTPRERAMLFNHVLECVKPSLPHIGRPRPAGDLIKAVSRDSEPIRNPGEVRTKYPEITGKRGMNPETQITDFNVTIGWEGSLPDSMVREERLLLTVKGEIFVHNFEYCMTDGPRYTSSVVTAVASRELGKLLHGQALKYSLAIFRDWASAHAAKLEERACHLRTLEREISAIRKRAAP